MSGMTSGGSWRAAAMTITAEVGVNDDDGVAGRFVEARRDGGLLSEVTCETEHGEAGVFIGPGVEQVEGFVGAAVVDEEDLSIAAEGGEAGGHPLAEEREGSSLVEDGNDDREQAGRPAGGQ